jgi:hypothetical protein
VIAAWILTQAPAMIVGCYCCCECVISDGCSTILPGKTISHCDVRIRGMLTGDDDDDWQRASTASLHSLHVRVHCCRQKPRSVDHTGS